MQQDIERARRAYIDMRVARFFLEPPAFDPRDTLYFRILDELTRDLATRAVERGTPDIDAIEEQYDTAQSCYALLLSYAPRDSEAGSEAYCNLWRHFPTAADHDTAVAPDGEDLAYTLEQYFRQPARSNLLNRTLIDMLMAREMMLLGAALAGDMTARGKTAHALKPLSKLLLSVAGRTLLTTIALALFAAGGMAALDGGLIDRPTAVVGGIAIIFLTPLLSANRIVARLADWWRERRRCHQLHTTMRDTYALLENSRSALPIATLQMALDSANAEGADWPGVVLVLKEMQRRAVTQLPPL